MRGVYFQRLSIFANLMTRTELSTRSILCPTFLDMKFHCPASDTNQVFRHLKRLPEISLHLRKSCLWFVTPILMDIFNASLVTDAFSGS